MGYKVLKNPFAQIMKSSNFHFSLLEMDFRLSKSLSLFFCPSIGHGYKEYIKYIVDYCVANLS